MRTAQFAVPSEVMAEFANELAEHNLNNTITGTNEGEILIKVEYERDESDAIDELEETLEELREQLEEGEEEDK